VVFSTNITPKFSPDERDPYVEASKTPAIALQMMTSMRWGTDTRTELVVGASCTVFTPRLAHLSELFDDALRFPERFYMVQGPRRLSFAALQSTASRFASEMFLRGVRRGDRVLLYGANSIEWVASFWAITVLGAVAVFGNCWWSDEELTHALRVTSPTLVLADQPRSSRLPPDVPRLLLHELETLVDLETPGDAPFAPRPPDASEDDPAIIPFTSGTTGLPKAVVLSHRGVLAALHAMLEKTHRLPNDTPPDPSASLISLPLFHVGGFQQLLLPLVAGGTLVFTEGRFDPAQVVELIEVESISVWSTVPTMVTKVVDYLDDQELGPITTIRTLALGGAPVPEQLRARVPNHFPNVVRRLVVSYGMSELCGVIATGAGDEVRTRPGTVGRPLTTVEIRIDHPDEGGTGEVIVRSPTVMLGYLEPDGTLADSPSEPLTPDRWLHTGDVGRYEDGYLFITDRLKDVVIRGGENIATPHVEDVLLGHPAVREAAVVGLPDRVMGEEVGAIVVLRPGFGATPQELQTFLLERLAYFEVPTRWLFREEALPVNMPGKVMKRELRTQWLQILEEH
jgi:long-chain acyl-CoA synthetase